MKQENINFLEENKHYWEVYKQAQIVKHLDQATRQRMFEIIREEFSPNYIISLWCSSCIGDLLKMAYTQYEKYLAANPKPELTSVKDIAIDHLNQKHSNRKVKKQSRI